MTDRKCFVFKFADVEVREREFVLIKAGEPLALEPKAFRVLLFLLQNPGRLVSKDEIVASVWSESVTDNSLTRSIAQLRRVLGDDSRQPLYILTVPTVGYRFLCEVSATDDGFGASSRAETNGKRNGGPRAQPAAPPAPVPAFEIKTSRESAVPSRRMLIAGLAAALVIFAAGAMIWRAFGTKAVSSRDITYPLIEQRITSNPPEDPIQGAVISPDGKYLAYADPTGLYLRELSTGETRPWELPAAFVARPTSWFPDSTHLLVVRIEGPPQMPDLQKWSLYKLSLLGGPPQRILENAAAGSVSPDGTQIAYLRGPGFGSELWVMNADGTNARQVVWAGVLKKPGPVDSWIIYTAWSPGGRRIAYIEGHGGVGSDPYAPTVSLMTIQPNGGGLSEVWNDSRVGDALWWAPDGRILFAYEDPSSEKQDYGIYSLHIDEQTGKAVGSPQPVTQAEGRIARLSGTADGKRLVLWRTKAPFEAFIARFDTQAHQFQEPRRLTLDENQNYASAWTADSKAVLFVSNRNGVWRLFRQGIDQTTPDTLVEAASIVLPRLSPDGSNVLYLTGSRPGATSGPVSVIGKPLAGGPPHLVIADEGIVNYGCARAPSPLCVFSKLDGQDLIFVSFDGKDGANRRDILKMKSNDLRNWVISPDGSKLAIVLDPHRVRFFALDNGTSHDVTVNGWPLGGADWSANSRTVFITSVTSNAVPVILEVDQAGKARVVLRGSANTGFNAMIQSPDSQYGLLIEWIQAESNAWMVDNF